MCSYVESIFATAVRQIFKQNVIFRENDVFLMMKLGLWSFYSHFSHYWSDLDI